MSRNPITGRETLLGPAPGVGYDQVELPIIGQIAASAEEHGIDVTYEVTCASGSSAVGLNMVVTPAGSAASWVSAFYGKVVQTGTKYVNGYLCAAELEVVLGGTYNPSDWAVLVLNATDNNANPGNTTHRSYIMLRDYGTSTATALFAFMEEDVASAHDSGRMLVESTAIPAVTDDNYIYIRCLVGTTPIWLIATKTAPS